MGSRRPLSLNLRLLLASLLILPLFLGVTAVILERAFHERQVADQAERMRLQQLLLARAANWNGRKWSFEGLDEIRFRLADSGLYAFILSPNGEMLWQSPSAELLAEAEGKAQSLAGVCNGKEFVGFRDLDDLVSSVFEVVTANGKYYWIPMGRVRSLEFFKPTHPHDLVWRSAHIVVEDGPQGVVYLPVLYAGTHRSDDDRIRQAYLGM